MKPLFKIGTFSVNIAQGMVQYFSVAFMFDLNKFYCFTML